MARWKYLLIVVGLASWLASQVLTFISSYADWPLEFISLGCSLAILLFIFRAVLWQKWREFTIFMFALVIMILPELGVPQLTNWLQVAGFRFYTTPPEVYLSRCKLFDFVDDDGSRQKVGYCDVIPLTTESWLSVIYDTTGQIALSADHRTHAWQSTVSWHLSAGAFLAYRDHDDAHIFGNFYYVVTTLYDEDGNDGS